MMGFSETYVHKSSGPGKVGFKSTLIRLSESTEHKVIF